LNIPFQELPDGGLALEAAGWLDHLRIVGETTPRPSQRLVSRRHRDSGRLRVGPGPHRLSFADLQLLPKG
jgi:hypothetical protein